MTEATERRSEEATKGGMADAILQAELTWIGEGFESDVQVAIRDGRISEVGAELGDATRVMPSRALLPGFVNAHSHAFQRAL